MDWMEIDDGINTNKKLKEESPTTKVDCQRRKQPSRCATVCLGLLCVLLLAGNVGQIIYYEIISSIMSADPTPASNNTEADQLQSSCDERKELESRLSSLTTERAQLQQSYNAERDQFNVSFNNLKNKTDRLQASYNTLKQESDQLQTSYNDMQRNLEGLKTHHNNLTASKDQLQAEYGNLQRENNELQGNYSTLKGEKGQLQRSCNQLNISKIQLQIGYSSLQREKEILQTSYNTLQRRKEQLQTRNSGLQQEKDQLQTLFNQLQGNYSSLRRDKDELQRSYNTQSRSKNQLQINYNSLQREKEKLQTSCNTLQGENELLQEKVDKLKRTVTCPLGWLKFDVNCYYVSTFKYSWTSSKAYCITKGANLVVIDSRDEQAMINRLLAAGDKAWIGLHDRHEEGTWNWVDGTAVTTTYWQEGQPNSFLGEQDCVEIVQTSGVGEWTDKDCSVKQKFVCEK